MRRTSRLRPSPITTRYQLLTPSPPPSAILVKARHAVFQLDAGQQLLAHALFQLAQRAHGVFAVDVVARVHQAVGQVAGVGEQQQALGVEVEAADGQPLAGLHGRQAVEHGRTAFRIVRADDFAGRLVVHQHARRLVVVHAALQQLAVDAHGVGRQDALADVGRLAVHRHAAGDDQFFHVAARTQAGFGQHLVQLRRVVFGGQVAARLGGWAWPRPPSLASNASEVTKENTASASLPLPPLAGLACCCWPFLLLALLALLARWACWPLALLARWAWLTLGLLAALLALLAFLALLLAGWRASRRGVVALRALAALGAGCVGLRRRRGRTASAPSRRRPAARGWRASRSWRCSRIWRGPRGLRWPAPAGAWPSAPAPRPAAARRRRGRGFGGRRRTGAARPAAASAFLRARLARPAWRPAAGGSGAAAGAAAARRLRPRPAWRRPCGCASAWLGASAARPRGCAPARLPPGARGAALRLGGRLQPCVGRGRLVGVGWIHHSFLYFADLARIAGSRWVVHWDFNG